jgi:S-DNA-T family DNA segregation ATPase FtsK/SpoIIIE
MATVAAGARQDKLAQWRSGMRKGMRRTARLLLGGGLGALALLLLLALVSYKPTDPSLDTAAAGPVGNWIGAPGAYAADLLLALFGPPAALLLPFVGLAGFRIARLGSAGRWVRSLLLTLVGIVLIGAAAGLLAGGAVNGLPAAWGGALGLSLARLIGLGLAKIGEASIVQPFRIAAMVLLTAGGLAFAWFGLALSADEREWIATRRLPKRPRALPSPAMFADEDDDEDDYPVERPARAPVVAPAEPPRTVIADRVRAPEAARRPARDRQPSLALGDSYQLPGLELLAPAPRHTDTKLDKASL